MSPDALPVLPFEFAQQGDFQDNFTYTVPASGEVQPYTATATFTNGSGQAVQPTLSLYSANGNLLARVFPVASLADGDDAEVTWVPPFGSAASSSPSGGGITEITSADFSVTVTDPFGPVTNLAVASSGVQYEQIGDTATLTVASGMSGFFSLKKILGDSLLSFTTPTAPTFLNDGLYGMTCLIMENANVPVASAYYIRAFLVIGSSIIGGGGYPMEGTASSDEPSATVPFFSLASGSQTLRIQVFNDDPANSHTFALGNTFLLKFPEA